MGTVSFWKHFEPIDWQDKAVIVWYKVVKTVNEELIDASLVDKEAKFVPFVVGTDPFVHVESETFKPCSYLQIPEFSLHKVFYPTQPPSSWPSSRLPCG